MVAKKPPKPIKSIKKAAKTASRLSVPSKEREEELIASAVTLIEPTKKFADGEKETQEAKLLMFQWALEGGEQTPQQWMQAQGYSFEAAKELMKLVGGSEEFRAKRRALQDQVTEKIAKRYVDRIAEMSEGHLKSSNLVHLKSIEFLSKLSIEPARDAKGKMIMDGKGKPVFRGIRSQDILNAALAVKESQNIMRKALGISDRDEMGLAQILNKIEQKSEIHNTQVNIHVTSEEKEISAAVAKLSYDDVVGLIKAKRRAAREIEVKKMEEAEDE